MWLLYVQLLEGQNRYGIVWALMINPPELPIIDEARNDSPYFNHKSATVLAQKTKWETGDAL